MLALKARQEYSPGQRPGNKGSREIASPEGALHTRRNPCADTCLSISTVSPLQGCALVGPQNPGRCPGLYYQCPFSASGSLTIRSVACFEGVAGFLESPLGVSKKEKKGLNNRLRTRQTPRALLQKLVDTGTKTVRCLTRRMVWYTIQVS